MILDNPSRALQVVLGEATATTNCDIVACFAQATPDTFVPQTVALLTAGTTAVTLLQPPPRGMQFLVNEVRVFNNDTIAHLVTLQLLDGTVVRVIMRLTVPASGHFTYHPRVVPSP